MVQMIYEADPYNEVYNGELDEILPKLENSIKEVAEKYNVVLVYIGGKYPNELACAIRSDFVKFPTK